MLTAPADDQRLLSDILGSRAGQQRRPISCFKVSGIACQKQFCKSALLQFERFGATCVLCDVFQRGSMCTHLFLPGPPAAGPGPSLRRPARQRAEARHHQLPCIPPPRHSRHVALGKSATCGRDGWQSLPGRSALSFPASRSLTSRLALTSLGNML